MSLEIRVKNECFYIYAEYYKILCAIMDIDGAF